MKIREKWTAQPEVDQAADELLRENGGDMDKVLGNQVAVRLGMTKANQSVYDELKVWRGKRQAEGTQFVAHAPEGLRSALDAKLQPVVREVIRIALGMTGQAIADKQKAFDVEKGALRASLAKAGEDKRMLLGKVEDGVRSIASLETQIAELRSQLETAGSELVASRAREAELRSINFKLMARIGEPDDDSPDTVELNIEPNSRPATPKWEIDMSRYDYDESLDG